MYIVYAIFYVPFSGTLVSGAVGLISFGLLGSYEAAVALTILAGIFFALLTKRKGEGFADSPGVISERISANKQKQEPGGVFASSFVEGFESQDASGSAVHVDTTVSSPTSNPAPATATATATAPVTMTMPGVDVPSATSTGATAPQPAAGSVSSGFRSGGGKEPEGLFKLGAIPEDAKGGFHIDQGTTVMNALNALKPDQIQQMSADTQKLIDTQKSLMSMLSTVKPMMQDGKQMMDTFQQMFGSGNGGALQSNLV